MQVKNVNLPIVVTGRHVSVTEAMRQHAEKKVAGLHLDYPKIIEAKVILNVENEDRHIAEIILFCANHITIEADTTGGDMYAAIDETISKIARRMRKHKTRMLKSHRPKRQRAMREIPEAVFAPELPEEPESEHEPVIVHKEKYKVKHLYSDEAIMDMEMNEKPFIIFHDAKTDRIAVLYRREDGDYGMVLPTEDGEPVQSPASQG